MAVLVVGAIFRRAGGDISTWAKKSSVKTGGGANLTFPVTAPKSAKVFANAPEIVDGSALAASLLTASTASPIEIPGATLKESVTAGSWPE